MSRMFWKYRRKWRCSANFGLLFLCIIAAVSQIVTFSLKYWERKGKFSSPSVQGYNGFRNIVNAEIELLQRINDSSALDESGEFRIVLNAVQSQIYNGSNILKEEYYNTTDGFDISLVTQTSLHGLKFLPELAKRWQGPISVAVFVATDEIQVVVPLILALRFCIPVVADYINFSVIFPSRFKYSSQQKSFKLKNLCHNFNETFEIFSSYNYQNSEVSYPNNLLRNAAIQTVQTEFMMVIDVDMVPSVNLRRNILNMVKRETSVGNFGQPSIIDRNVVWIIPSYELQDGVRLPQTKKDLLQLKQVGSVRPFYVELCQKCQRYTDYERWESSVDGLSSLYSEKAHPLYEVLWKDPWEPFYVSRSDIPRYDNRFRQYGFNRISQVCELHVAGYRFVVLDGAFLIHRGFKRKGQFHPSKDKEQNYNRILFRQFKEDLKIKYPDSSKRCY